MAIIDLAVLRLHFPIPQTALEKAKKAYGDVVIKSLQKSIQHFQERPDYRERCFSGLQIGPQSQIPKIMDGVDLLAEDLGLTNTLRTFNEQRDFLADL